MLFFLLVSFLSAVYGKTKSDGKIVVAYLTDWSGYDASKIDYTVVTNVHYSFATLTEQGAVNIPSGLNPSLVDTVHAGGAVISLAIGGDGGSEAYKKAVTPSVRQTTINSIANVISKYRLDGVDIDWEFPQKDDYDNYLAFLVALRKKLGPNAWISACTNVFPFIGKDGNYVKDASEFAKVLSFIFIMAYDINGSWNSITAPNAPLEDKSGNSPIDVKGSVQNWRKARFPYNQIVLGVPFYGRGVKVMHSMANNKPNNEAETVNQNYEASIYSFTQILRLLDSAPYKYDTATSTPWTYLASSNEYVSFDDANSIWAKTNYAACTGLLGIGMWDVSLDNGLLLPYLKGIHTCNTATPAHIPIPKSTPLSDATSRCGSNWSEANTACHSLCQSDGDCPNSLRCFGGLTNVAVCKASKLRVLNRNVQDMFEPFPRLGQLSSD